MEKKRKWPLTLQLFAEGFGGDGAEAGEGTNNDGSNDGLANQNDEVEYLYGRQDDDPEGYEEDNTSDISPEGSENASDDEYETFREKYKDRIGQDIQDAVQKRFKNQASYEEQFNSLNDGLTPLFYKYGLDVGDTDGLIQALSDDTALYEEAAYESGMEPEVYKKQQELIRENEILRQNEAKRMAQQKAEDDFRRWTEEGNQLKTIYPNFDMSKEWDNPDFRNDLLHNGKSVRKAFEAAHLDEIVSGAIQKTAQETEKRVTNNIRARGMRPSENGTVKRPGVVVKNDVNSLTDKDIDRIYDQVKKGATISF